MTKPDLILLALDDSPIRQLMERALRASNYEVAMVSDRKGLEKALQSSSPALLLIGEKFNSQAGIPLAAEQLERFPTMPILVYAEKDSPTIPKEILRANLSGYLYPPLRTDDIVAAVGRSLDRARHLGDWIRREVRRTTASLQRQVNDFEAIFANMSDGIIILDRSNRIILVNEAVRNSFGVTAAVVGRPLLEAINHPDIRSLLERAASEDLKYHEINFDDGRVFNGQFTVIPEIGSAITIQDITYLKELDRIKNDFIHTVSHDLRSPLTAVLGYAELVARMGPLNDQQQDFLRRLQASVQDITSLVNDLLDLGRLEAGFDTRREIVQLENILDYTVNILSGQAEAREVKLRVERTPRLPPLRANPIRLRQMLDNLIGNAIKYTPPGGEVKLCLRPEDHQIILEVTDTGPGIPPADQPHIFEKFYRASNVPDDVPGSGLGLAIVKSIVDSHQGRIWVESRPGEGSSFFVVLPVYEAGEVIR